MTDTFYGSSSKEIRQAIRVVGSVIEDYPRLTLSQLHVLLMVLDKPGVRASELMKLTGLSKSTMSITLRVLGSEPFVHDGNKKQYPGMNLITQIEDPADRRGKLIAPTRMGRRVGEKINKILGDKDGT